MGAMVEDARRAAVITVSDGVTHGTREDASGDAAEAILREAGSRWTAGSWCPDERPDIERVLREASADHGLVVTTGGTGFGPRDVTPEATKAVIEREAPGLAELMRSAGVAHTPMAALSRAVVGQRGQRAHRQPAREPQGRPGEPGGRDARWSRTRWICSPARPAHIRPATPQRTRTPTGRARRRGGHGHDHRREADRRTAVSGRARAS